MDNRWQINLFGSLQVRLANETVSRFQTYKTGAILAYMAYNVGQSVPREVLAELFWPEAGIEGGRNSLRVALNSLRKQIEPPEVPVGSVLEADRVNVRLNPEAVSTDVAMFEKAIAEERRLTEGPEAEELLLSAVGLYTGPLLANYYEEWMLSERERLSDLYLATLRKLSKRLVVRKEYERALELSRLAVSADPLREGAHRDLMRLYVAMGRPAAALQQFHELERRLREDLGSEPSAVTVELVRQLSEGITRLPATPDAQRGEFANPAFDSAITLHVAAAPPPAIPPVSTGAMPLQLSSFFGRNEELEAIRALIEDAPSAGVRLISVTGPGGAGKTRLAIEAGSQARERLDGRVWFVDLADITDGALILDAVASTLKLPHDPERPPLDHVNAFLRTSPALLILDNFEQISSAGDFVIEALLQECPELLCLITSQRRLDIAGEFEMQLAPLPTPGESLSPMELLEFPSVRLFVDRARTARPDFALNERNAAVIAALCARLEGVPLAIELAAAWAQMLTPSQMLERLGDRFELLVSPRRRGLARHRTLRAATDWSFQLLDPDLQRMFACLSVFRGTWDLRAAEEILDSEDGLERLWALRQRSLIVISETNGAMRCRMLELLRTYASEKLQEPELSAALRAHSSYYAKLVIEAAPHLSGLDAAAALDRLEEEHSNIRAALDWLAEHEPAAAVEMAGRLWRFWYGRGHVTEGCRWMDRLLPLAAEAPPLARQSVYFGAGRLAEAQADHERASAAFSLALDISGPDHERQVILACAAAAARGRGDTASARALNSELLDIRRRTATRWSIASALDTAALLALRAKDYPEAEAHLREALALRECMADEWSAADTHGNLAELYARTGRTEDSRWHHEQSERLFVGLDERWGIAATYLSLGHLAAEQGDYAAAAALGADSLAIFRDIGEWTAVARTLLFLSEVSLRQGCPAHARPVVDECIRLYREHGDCEGLADALPIALEAAWQLNDTMTLASLEQERNSLAEGRHGRDTVAPLMEG